MKIVCGVVLLAGLVALAHAFPGVRREADESVEGSEPVIILPARGSIFDDRSDEELPPMPGFWHPFRFDSSPFEGLFTRMQETMNRFRQHMAQALGEQLGGLTPWQKIPEGANTTSTTKIIGDHAVTINETTYQDDDENGATIFRIRVIDVKPLNETADAAAADGDNGDEESAQPTAKPAEESNENREELTTPGSRSVETVEEFDNEIPKSQVDTLQA